MISEKIKEDEHLIPLSYLNISKEEYQEAEKGFKYFPYYAVSLKNIIVKFCKKGSSHYLYAFSSFVTVKESILSEDGKTFIKLRFNNGSEMTERIFPTSVLSVQGIKELLEYGATFDEKYSNDLVNFLIKRQNKAKRIHWVLKVGWKEIDNNLIFDTYQRIDKEGYWSTHQLNSSFDLKPKGEFAVWEEMVKKEVCGNIPMEFVLALGFASPVLSLLNETYDLGSIVFNLANLTSTGKTTAAMLAASVFGNPKIGEGAMISYNATKNALLATLAFFNSFTVVIDEIGTSEIKDFSKFLYSVCLGSSKKRLDGNAQIKKTEQYSSFIISTAEHDILSDDSEGGLRARVFEIDDILTKSAENSDNIKYTVADNYALAGDLFVYHLLINCLDSMEDEYSKIKKALASKFVKTNNNIKERVISKFAVVLLTAKYCNSCEDFHFKFTYKKFFDYTVKQVKKALSSYDRIKMVREIIKQEITINAKFYPEKIGRNIDAFGIYGFIEKKPLGTYCYILTTVFKSIMIKNKISDYQQILNEMRDNGILFADKGGFTKSKMIKGNDISTYCIII